MTASDVMTPDPTTVTSEATIAEAADLMRELNVRHLPVVGAGVLIGMLSERDLVSAEEGPRLGDDAPGSLRAYLTTPVSRVMNSDVIAVEPDTELSEVVSLLVEHRIGAVPVVRPGTWQIVGIVSYVDVLRAVQDLLGEP